MNKPLWYDVDDLVIDTKYTDQIPFLDRMQPEERQAYDQNVRNMGELLSLCDAAVTTTAALAEELKQYVPEVLINRNCASDEMLLLSEEVVKRKTEKRNEADGTAKKVRLGYFSGSATHLDDIEMIVPVLKQLLGKNPNLELLIVGILELPGGAETVCFPDPDGGLCRLPKNCRSGLRRWISTWLRLPIRFLTVRNRKINGWKRLWCRL